MSKFKKGQIWLRDYTIDEAHTINMDEYFVLFYVDDVTDKKVEAIQLTIIDEGAMRNFDFDSDTSFAKLAILLTS